MKRKYVLTICQERCSGDDHENCSEGDGGEQPKRCNAGRVVPTEKGREVSSTTKDLDVKEKARIQRMKSQKVTSF